MNSTHRSMPPSTWRSFVVAPTSFVRASVVRTIVMSTAMLSLGGAAWFGPAFVTDALAEDALGYQTPPQVLADMVLAPPTPGVALSPNEEWMLLMESPGLPSIAEVAEPELRLAGLRMNPRTNGQSRERPMSGISFQPMNGGEPVIVGGFPADTRINHPRWSPDGNALAFVAGIEDRLELWVVGLGESTARRVTAEGARLNGVYGRPYEWRSDSKSIVALVVPEDRGAPPVESYVPTGPIVQENLGKTAAARTLQDLLENPYDESVFDYYATSQIELIGLDGSRRKIGEPGVIRGVEPSPDGRYLLAETIHHPYSYSLQEDSFPRRIEVWNLKDASPAHLVVDRPLQDEVPIAFGSVETGPRSVSWRDDAGATLVWTEALDGGDGGAEAEWRDQVFLLEAPFQGKPKPVIKLSNRYGGVQWGTGDLALVSSWWWATRNVKTWLIAPDHLKRKPKLVQDRSYQDRYSDPGNPMTMRNAYGKNVILTVDGGKTIFLSGQGASPEGNRPFIDRYDVASGETERLFHSEAPYYENPVELLGADHGSVLTRRESQTEPPNYFVRNLADGSLEQKTFFANPTPQLEGISKELITYERADGLSLSGTLYLPAGYDKDRDGPLPVLLWAYPNEYKSRDDAGQVTDSPYRFTRVGWWSPMLFLTRGYAVLDDPSMPIIGEGDTEPNDTFVEQLVSSAEAAVRELVRRGVGDPDRMAVGGHSYGAFMTANLLAHSELFRAGLPRSGAYNRTLTPFGFQSEERTFWEAPEIYFEMSPFMHADKINEPILLVHGEADNNAGTYPMQSERMYAAIKGLGGTARLVMLPAESHGYRAAESVLHLMWETDRWLETYVKNAGPRDVPSEGDGKVGD